MKKTVLIILFLGLYFSSFAQNFYIKASCKKIDNYIEWNCDTIYATRPMKIIKTRGRNCGFRIENKYGIIKIFGKQSRRKPSAKGFILSKGKYVVYPEFCGNTSYSRVEIYFRYE